MALQADCDFCGDCVNADNLVYIERYDNMPMICNDCVNKEIDRLSNKVLELEKDLAIERWDNRLLDNVRKMEEKAKAYKDSH